MAEKIKSAIEALKTMYPKKCKMVDGRLTGGYDDYESEKGQVITLAIRSLQAWDEVLNKLEKATVKDIDSNFADAYGIGKGLQYAIDIINQKLEGVKK